MHAQVSSEHFLLRKAFFFKQFVRVPDHPQHHHPSLLNLDGLPLKTVNNNYITSNGNSTECSSIWPVIMIVITKSDYRPAGVRFVHDDYVTGRIGRHEVLLQINHKNYNFREKKDSQVIKEMENLH